MEINRCIKESFSVIGKEGSTNDGENFIAKLWDEANSQFDMVKHLAKTDKNGSYAVFWGAMSDFSHSFLPWENGFSQGLYLAGFEALDNVMAPDGWIKWIIPSYEYIYVINHSGETFNELIKYLQDNNINLAGAVHEYTDSADGQSYLYAPIKKL